MAPSVPPTAPETASPRVSLRSLDDLELGHRRVLVRADFNVPLDAKGAVLDDGKLRAALPTLNKVLGDGARVVVATHLHDAAGKPISLEPLAAKLAELLEREVYLPDECVGDAARKVVGDLREGQLCLLENLDFKPEEQQGDDGLARKLAALCDVYVNEAFAVCHERRASITALPRLLQARGMGYRLKTELEALSRAAVTVQRPFIGFLGGASLSQNLDVLEMMLKRCSVICVAGVPGNTLLAAREQDMKASKLEREQLALGRTLLARARDQKVELLLPLDAVVASDAEASEIRAVGIGSVPDGHGAFDVGPKTVEAFAARLRGAKTLLWHGALGHIENPAFQAGTNALLEALADSPAFGVVTGTGLSRLAQQRGPEAENKMGFVSTGGMASLAVIEGKKLAGVEALRE